MKIDTSKHSVEEIVTALHEKLMQVTPQDCTKYVVEVTSQGVDKWLVTEGVDYVRKHNVQSFNLRGEWVGRE